MNLDQIRKLKLNVESLFSADLWLDFEVISYESAGGGVLIVAASRDFTYYHNIEIIFNEVAYFCGAFAWKASPSKSGIIVPDGDASVIVPSDADIAVKFVDDDGLGVVVAASSASINTDTVFYYDKSPLAANERVAKWVHR